MQREVLLTIYIMFFAFVHSLTAANFFKKAVYRFFEARKYRILYTIFSIFTVLPLLYLWLWNRGDSPHLYSITFPYTIITHSMLISGAALLLNSLILIDLLDFTGLKQIIRTKPKGPTGLVTNGAYGIVRHPLYVGAMLVLWSNPSMRLVDFIVALLFSFYFVIGAILEERKLLEEFGEEYRDYKKKVSMFIPLKWLSGLIKS